MASRDGSRASAPNAVQKRLASLRPTSRFDLVRFGIAIYGLSPAPGVVSEQELGLTPAMTVQVQPSIGKLAVAQIDTTTLNTFTQPMTLQPARLVSVEG